MKKGGYYDRASERKLEGKKKTTPAAAKRGTGGNR